MRGARRGREGATLPAPLESRRACLLDRRLRHARRCRQAGTLSVFRFLSPMARPRIGAEPLTAAEKAARRRARIRQMEDALKAILAAAERGGPIGAGWLKDKCRAALAPPA